MKNGIPERIARIEEHINVINREMGEVQNTAHELMVSNNQDHNIIKEKLDELRSTTIKISVQQKYLIALASIISAIVGAVLGYTVR